MTRAGLGLLAVGAASIAVRAVGITQPFVDQWSWRQADVAMIAENFYRHGFDPLYPRINWAGAAPGYVGTELPLVPALAAAMYRVLGVHDWIGRCVSLGFFAASLPLLYLLVARLSGRRAALLATIVYSAVPVSIVSARSFMPDTASLAFAMAAVWLFLRWLDQERGWWLAGAGLAAAVALLVKLAAAPIVIPMLALGVRKYGRRLLGRVDLWTTALAVTVVTAAWYLHGYRIRLLHPPYHYFGSGVFGVTAVETYAAVFERIVMRDLSPGVVSLTVAGLVLSGRRVGRDVLAWWLLGALLFIGAGAGGYHPWYALPLVPATAGLAGVALHHIHRRLQKAGRPALARAAIGLVVVILVVSTWRAVIPVYASWNQAAYRAGMALARLSPPDALLAVVDGGDPTTLYYSRRRGWHFMVTSGAPSRSEQAVAELERLRGEGLHSLTFLRHTRWWLTSYPGFAEHLTGQARVVEETSDYVIFVFGTG